MMAAVLLMGGLTLMQPALAAPPDNVGTEGGGTGSALEDMITKSQTTGEGSGLAPAGANVDIRITISKMIRVLMQLLGTITVVLIIYAGFLWMTAGGNEEQISKAKKMITNAVIGLIIIIMAYSIAGFVIDRVTGAGSPGAPQPTTIF